MKVSNKVRCEASRLAKVLASSCEDHVLVDQSDIRSNFSRAASDLATQAYLSVSRGDATSTWREVWAEAAQRLHERSYP